MPSTKQPKSIDEKLQAAQRAQDTMTIYLPGPLRAEWNRVKAEFDLIKAREEEMLNPSRESKRLAKELERLEQQMREDAIDVTVQALRRERTPTTPDDEAVWTELCDAHPPRKGEDGKPHPNDAIGVNAASFPEALIRASLIEPALTDDQWDRLLYELMTDAQFDGLFQKCWRLNRGSIDVPFSSLASKTLRSEARSSKPNGSASPTNASKGGSRKK